MSKDGPFFHRAPHDDYAADPVPGLPERLPEGERILWQGKPSWTAFFRRAYRGRLVTLYFAALIVWRLGDAVSTGAGWRAGLDSALGLMPLALASVALLALLAWLSARATIYTITSRRVVLRIGAALDMTVQIPFRFIDGVGLRRHRDGTGDLALTIGPGQRMSYLILWPHARPLRILRPEPMLRGLPDADAAAAVLAEALKADAARLAAIAATTPAAEPAARPAAIPQPAPQPAAMPGSARPAVPPSGAPVPA
jgi:hypothetical protein